jgi:hypothetical protein
MNIDSNLGDQTRRHALFRLSGVFLTLAVDGLAQADKPNFSGRWVVDKERSERPGDLVDEVIEHIGLRLVITTAQADGTQFAVRLSADGKENPNIVGGRELTATTTWDGKSLVTIVRDKQGMQFTEVRSLSDGGNVQTTEGFRDPGRTRLMFKRVTTKKD